jgi:hypothetical protein
MNKFLYYYEMCRRVRFLSATPKIWNYIKFRFLMRKAVMSMRRYTPQIAALWVTKRCNLDCAYCSVGRILKRGKDSYSEDDINLEKVKHIFANPLFANCLLVDLLGGEPLLVKDLESIVAHLSKHGHLTNVSTNGLLLADRIADLKSAGLSRINISLYDKNRLVLERNLAKINRVFPVDTSMVLLRGELEKQRDKLFDTVRFVHDAGCRSIRFFIYRAVGLNPQPEEIIGDGHPGYIDFRRCLDEEFPRFCLWPAVIPAGEVKKLCPQLWQRITCDSRGNMPICCGTDMVLQGPHSNLFNSDPGLVINHPTLVAMRKQLLDRECEPPVICKTCNLLGDSGW